MLIRLNKPYGVLCQFRDADGRATLASLLDQPGVYPAGRLDFDSEGLLLLTDDGPLQARIAEPRHKLAKTYLVQVEARLDQEAFLEAAARLRAGVPLRDGTARAVSVRQIDPPDLQPRTPPVTPHRAGRSSWVEVVLTEGRNRQVRRMLAAVGMPVLRLVRSRIGSIDLGGLGPGEWESIAVPPDLAVGAGRTASREQARPRSGRRPRA